MGKKRDIIIIGGSIALAIIMLISSFYMFLYFDNKAFIDSYYPNTKINDIDISEMTLESARETIESSLLDPSLSFTLNDKEKYWEIPLANIVTCDIESTLEEILKEQGENSLFEAFRERQKLKKEPEVRYVTYSVKEDLRDLLGEINTEVETPAKDAEFIINNQNQVEIISHSMGIGVDVEETIKEILASLDVNSNNSTIVYKDISPDILVSDLENLKVTDLLFSVETSYGGTGGNRIFNIQLAASKINNYLLLPGEEFSFNNIVGKADKDSGYKEAIIIVNGKFVPGYGGGVCQVSSNIYVGALKANLEILQRRNHGRPVSYLPRGLDATIAYPSLDLRFRNNTPYGIIISTRSTNSELIVDFFSYKPHYNSVRFEHEEEVIPFEIEYKDNPNLKEGEQKIIQRGANGYRVVTYRIQTVDGNEIKELISKDTYRPLKQIIEVGTKPASSNSLTEEDSPQENEEEIGHNH